MRKHIVIALLGFGVLGSVVVTLVLRPWESPIDYHKREYVAALQGTWTERAQNALSGFFGKRPPAPSDDRFERLQKHRQALIDLGFLEQQQFDLTNRKPMTVIDQILGTNSVTDPKLAHVRREFVLIEPSTMRIVLVARRDDMPAFAEAIRKADAP